MRIVRIINWLSLGGVQVRLLHLLPRLVERGAEVHIVPLKKSGRIGRKLGKLGVTVHRVDLPAGRMNPVGIARLASVLRSIRPDVVHSHMYRAGVPATLAARMAGAPVVLGQNHNVDCYDSWRQVAVDACLARLRTGMVTVSEPVREETMRRLRLPRERVHLLYNGIDLAEFTRAPDRSGVRAELGVPPTMLLVAWVARLHPQKNHIPFIEELPAILRDSPAFRLLLVGGGDHEAAIRAAVERVGVADRVLFLGQRRDVPRLLGACDAAILPSQKEGFSNVILECMASGLPQVVTAVGGAREALEHGRSAFIHEATDLAGCVRSLRVLLGDAALRRSMGEHAREDVARFSLDAMADQTMSLYERLLAGRQRRS